MRSTPVYSVNSIFSVTRVICTEFELGVPRNQMSCTCPLSHHQGQSRQEKETEDAIPTRRPAYLRKPWRRRQRQRAITAQPRRVGPAGRVMEALQATATAGTARVGVVDKERWRQYPGPARWYCVAPASRISATAPACCLWGELRLGFRCFLETEWWEQCGGWWRTPSGVTVFFYWIEMCVSLGLLSL